MGSTFVRFGDRGFEASDAQLEIWLLLLVAEIDRLPSPPPWLAEARQEWHLQATAGFGFGVMPGLDLVVTDTARREAVLDLSNKALARLRGHGEVMTKDQLNALTQESGGGFTEDLKTEVFTRVGEYWVKLLEGELKPEEIDARIFTP
jgi:hypothetical protein